MYDSVNEIESGPRPLINRGSVKVYDDKNRLLYIYGGIRWPDDENIKSPTRLPTADFYCYNSCASSKPWKDFTKSMRHDKSFTSPFHDRLSRPENSDLTLAEIACLPVLTNPIGTIVHDDTAAKTSYMLILGDPIGEEYEDCNNPILVCINLRINTWRRIKLKRSSKIPGGRAYASMIVSGQLRLPGCDVFLCVFGGVKEEVDEGLNTIISITTFAVANLSKEIWTVPNASLPNVVGRLGMHPGLAKYRDEKMSRDLVLILRGVVEQEDNNTENGAKATFSGTFLFDPEAADNQFAQVRVHPSSHFPSPSRTFFLQPSRSRAVTRNEFLLVTCGSQRELNEVPPIPGERNYRRRVRDMYKTPKVEVWIMDLHELGSESEPRADHSLQPPEAKEQQIVESADESSTSTEDDESNGSSDSESETEQSGKRMKHSDVLAQRAKRSEGQIVKRSSVTLNWRNVTSGRVKRSLELLSPAFRLEAAFIFGDIPYRFSQPEYELTHPLSPKLIFLGCDHEYIGEILGDAYNAFARISLHSLDEVDESESISSALPDDEEVSDGAETDIFTLSDDAMSVVEDEPGISYLKGVHSPASSIQDEWSQSIRTTLDKESSDVEALSLAGKDGPEYTFDEEQFDGVDTNLDPALFCHPQGPDAALLMSSFELNSTAAVDTELETIVQNVLSTEREDEWDAEGMDIHPSA